MEPADFDDFLRGLFLAVEAQRDYLRSGEHDEWADLDVGLMFKLLQTLTSIRALQKPTLLTVQGARPIQYVDFQSVGALTRTAVENCLVSDWLFGSGEPEKKALHRMVWQYGGLRSWADALPTTDEAKKAAEDAHRRAGGLWPDIEAGLRTFYPTFKNTKAISEGQWTKLVWIAEKASSSGHHRRNFRVIYDQLSGYAHSNFVSAYQTLAATSLPDQQDMAYGISMQLIPILAHTMRDFMNRYPAAMAAAGSSDFLMLIDEWSGLAEHQEKLLRNAWVKPAQ